MAALVGEEGSEDDQQVGLGCSWRKSPLPSGVHSLQEWIVEDVVGVVGVVVL